jgi:Spy/CpxP family protein refolding chaperone
MVRKSFGRFALAFVIGAGTGTGDALAAQEPVKDSATGGMGMVSMMQDCPMMGAMAQGPQAVLRHREELNLTNAQMSKLEAIRDSTKPIRAETMERMRSLHEQLRKATEGERFDEATVRTAFDRMGDLHTRIAVAMLRTRHEARQILTPEQREKLAGLGGGTMGMHRMMGMMSGMGMEDCPMMQGGMMGGRMDRMPMQDSGAKPPRGGPPGN